MVLLAQRFIYVFQFGVARQFVFEGGLFAAQCVRFGLCGGFRGKRRVRGFHLFALRGLLGLIGVQVGGHPLARGRLTDQLVHGFYPLVERFQLHRTAGFRLFVLLNQRFEQLDRFRERQLLRFRLLRLFEKQAVLAAADTADVLLHACTRRLALPEEGIRALFQAQLKRFIPARFENAAKNLLPLLGVRHEQLEKLALRNHRNHGELASVQTENAFQLGVRILGSVDHAPVRQMEFHFGRLFDEFIAAQRPAHILRIAAHGVNLVRAGKGHLDKGRRFVVGVLGAEHGRRAVFAARLVVERVGDGVENGGLTRARVAGNQVKSRRAERFEVDFGRSGIRSEGGQR